MKNLIKLSCLFIFSTAINEGFAQNIALHKKYKISLNTYYNVSAVDSTNTLLTDGVLATDFGWASPTSVAWHSAPRVSIEIDLEKLSNIKSVSVHTTRFTNRVFFPSNIFVFTSTDKSTYKYAGDAVADTVNNRVVVKNNGVFTLPAIDQHARYVLLIMIPKGGHLYCDEIEVSAGNSNDDKASLTMAKKDIDPYIDSIEVDQNEKNKSLYHANHLLNSDLKKESSNSLIANKVNPWQKINTPYDASEDKDISWNVTSVINGVQYEGFLLSNLSKDKSLVRCALETDVSNIASYQLYSVPFISSGIDYQQIPDPLIVTNNITLEPGESRLFIFKITGIKAGSIQTKISVKTNGRTLEFPVNIKIANIAFAANNFSLNAVNWAYLNFPLISDRKENAIQDLKNHHINSLVVPPDVMKRVGSTDLSSFQNYLNLYGKTKNLIIAGAFVSAYNAGATPTAPFLSDQWKQNFDNWYKNVVNIAAKAGYASSQIYFYAYDEPQGKSIDDFIKFLAWVRSAIPQMKIFGTLAENDAITRLLPLVDVGVIHTNAVSLSKNPGNTWLYDTSPNSETLSPYTYYRLMAWKAFFNNFKGIGFWNYSDYRDGSTNKVVWNKFNGVNGYNYGVIYDGPGNEIISSRRWEAFKIGIEDYELLILYAKAFGEADAKQFAKTVIDNPNNVDLADDIRNQIINKLNSKSSHH